MVWLLPGRCPRQAWSKFHSPSCMSISGHSPLRCQPNCYMLSTEKHHMMLICFVTACAACTRLRFSFTQLRSIPFVWLNDMSAMHTTHISRFTDNFQLPPELSEVPTSLYSSTMLDWSRELNRPNLTFVPICHNTHWNPKLLIGSPLFPQSRCHCPMPWLTCVHATVPCQKGPATSTARWLEVC